MSKNGLKNAVLIAIWISGDADGGRGGLASEAGKVLVFFYLTTPRHRPVSADLGTPRNLKMAAKSNFCV